MMRTFSIIAAVDQGGGIGFQGRLPWEHNSDDMDFFRDKTYNGVVIMGHRTFSSIGKPLPNRINIVISSQLCSTEGVVRVDSFDRAIREAITYNMPIYVIGGSRVYGEALKHPRLECVYITRIPGEHSADTHMPGFSFHKTCEFVRGSITVDIYDVNNEESQYINLMERLLDAPLRPNRTEVQTHGLFAEKIEFSLMRGNSNIIPLLTTKKVPFDLIVAELLWFISGNCTNVKYLHENNCHIWDGNTTREFLDSRGLADYDVGETGPIYGYQWRNWNGDYNNKGRTGIDQLAEVIENIRSDPFGRRHIVLAWNPEHISKMALPPCHYAFQFYCELIGEIRHLNCIVNMRSTDVAVGLPFNIASYSLLTHMVAKCVDMYPGRLVLIMADCHLYSSHDDKARVQCMRIPRSFPTLEFADVVAGGNIDQFKNPQQIILQNYASAPAIKYNMVV